MGETVSVRTTAAETTGKEQSEMKEITQKNTLDIAWRQTQTKTKISKKKQKHRQKQTKATTEVLIQRKI